MGSRGGRVASLLAMAVLASACFSRTTPVTAGEAQRGEAGFGAAVHEHFIYAVIVATRAAFVASGQVAMVDATSREGIPSDSLWQSYDGGRALRHCFVVQGGDHVCADAEIPEDAGGWGTSIVLVDPANLGRYFAETTVYATDTDRHFFMHIGTGAYDDAGARMPAGPTHGVWARVVDRGGVMHCQLETDGVPRCRDLGDDFRPPDNILGVFVDGATDVLWLSTRDQIHRCTASPTAPEPTCVPARMP